jgi:hypothetical protein
MVEIGESEQLHIAMVQSLKSLGIRINISIKVIIIVLLSGTRGSLVIIDRRTAIQAGSSRKQLWFSRIASVTCFILDEYSSNRNLTHYWADLAYEEALLEIRNITVRAPYPDDRSSTCSVFDPGVLSMRIE